MIKHILKFLTGGIIIAGLGWFAFFGLRYLAAQNDPEEKIMKQIAAQEKQYAEDPYGGSTPEETLALFIEALKKGDTELAAKYFVIDEQQNWREQLSKIQEKGLMGGMIDELNRSELSKKEDRAFFTLYDEQQTVVSELVMYKNQLNDKWKITRL